MKQTLTIVGTVLVVALAVMTFAARASQPQVSQAGVASLLQATTTAEPTPPPQVQATAPVLFTTPLTATQQAPVVPVSPTQPAQGTGTWGGMMGAGGHMAGEHGQMQVGMGMQAKRGHGMMAGGHMGGGPGMPQGMMGMKGSVQVQVSGDFGPMHGQMGVMTGGAYTMTHQSMMAGAPPTHAEVANMLGMTTQDLYGHMASGKSLVQIAAEKGATEQQLIDAMTTARKAVYDQAVQTGTLTQAQADALLQTYQTNLKIMVNAPGWSGWSMMWDAQPNP